MANKAGQVRFGFERVSEALREGQVAVLIEAAEAAADSRRKLGRKLRQTGVAPETVEVFASAELVLALGRPHVIHAAIAEGGLARKFLAAARRFEAYQAR